MVATDSGCGAETTEAQAPAPEPTAAQAPSLAASSERNVAEASFRTASGKPVACSSESLAHAARVVACYAEEPTATAHMRVASSGRHVYIAPERLQAAEDAYLRLSQEEEAGSDAEGVVPVGAHLTTGTGKLVHLSKESLAQAAEVVSCFSHEPPSRVHLMSGSGKKMKISPEAMDKACAVYARLSQGSADSVGDDAGGDAPVKKSDTLCLTTGAGKRITPCKRGYSGNALDPLKKPPAT